MTPSRARKSPALALHAGESFRSGLDDHLERFVFVARRANENRRGDHGRVIGTHARQSVGHAAVIPARAGVQPVSARNPIMNQFKRIMKKSVSGPAHPVTGEFLDTSSRTLGYFYQSRGLQRRRRCNTWEVTMPDRLLEPGRDMEANRLPIVSSATRERCCRFPTTAVTARPSRTRHGCAAIRIADSTSASTTARSAWGATSAHPSK